MLDLSQWGLGISRNSRLITQALTHRSYLNEDPDAGVDNERLEFLGDTIVDWVVTEYLYQRFPTLREGELTSLRAALVKGETLARFAVELDLPTHLRLSRGLGQTEGRARASILAGAFEAVVGAIYLERGLLSTRRFILRFIISEAERVHELRLDRDVKSVLQEFAQARWHLTPEYRLVKSYGPDHAKKFVVAVFVGEREWGRGVGSSRHRAEIAAAQNALATRRKIKAKQGECRSKRERKDHVQSTS